MSISTHSLTKRLTYQNVSFNPFYEISTHSLTKRLTRHWQKNFGDSVISTHSLTKRLTYLPAYPQGFQFHFNSQPHEEADCFLRSFRTPRDISTHSLTKRLTVASSTIPFPSYISTHSLTKRLTIMLLLVILPNLFQLTASRRG